MKDMNIPYIAGLVIRAQHSDSDAFAELYALTYNKVYNYTRHYLRDDFLAQDAMQEVYILALKNIGKLNDPTVFIAWLNRICFHVCYDMTQKNRPQNDCQVLSQEILDILFKERGYEFIDEMQRWFDILRFDKGTEILGSKGWTEKYRYFPIDQSEIDRSKGGLTQNPGWK